MTDEGLKPYREIPIFGRIAIIKAFKAPGEVAFRLIYCLNRQFRKKTLYLSSPANINWPFWDSIKMEKFIHVRPVRLPIV